MLEVLAIISLVIWILGVASSYTFGGLIHLFLLLAIILALLRIAKGRAHD
jgi:hypothetical protein